MLDGISIEPIGYTPPMPLVYRCRCGRVISLNKMTCKACGIAEGVRLTAEIERYKAAWAARLDAGFAGEITAAEEGNQYGEGSIVDGKMMLPPAESR